MTHKTSTAKTTESKSSPISTSTGKVDLHVQSTTQEKLLQLHRQFGNGAVQMMYETGMLQVKLKISQSSDKYEREADRVADQVMTMPGPRLQRQPENEEEEETVQAKSLADYITPLVQRQEEAPEEEELQAKSKPEENPAVTPSLEARINSLKGGGQSLDPATRNFYEPRFGHDFGHVWVHTDRTAANTAKAINARAFTLGNHVVMGSGEHYPNLQSGQRLLAHELTHVVQQSSGRHAGAMQRLVRGDATKQSITPAWAHALTDQELHDQIYLLRGHLEGLSAADPERAAVLGNLEVLEQEVLDRQAPAGPTGDRLVNEWLGLSAGQHLSSERAWIRGQWPVGGNLATLNATFRAGVQALLNFVATTPTAQFNIISYARSAPKQHVMHVSQYIRKRWMGYAHHKFSRWPGVLAAGGRANLLALPSHERRSHLRGITNPEVLSIVWDTGTFATSTNHGTRVAEMYYIGINNPVANSGAAYAWPTGNTSTSRHGSGDAVDAEPVQLPNVVTIRQHQAHTWPTLAALQVVMGAANVQVVAATAALPAGYTITGLSNVARRDAFFELFFQIRSAARAGFVDPAHFQAP